MQAQENNLLDLLGGDGGEQIQEKKEPLDTMAELSAVLGYQNDQQNTGLDSQPSQSNELFD